MEKKKEKKVVCHDKDNPISKWLEEGGAMKLPGGLMYNGSIEMEYLDAMRSRVEVARDFLQLRDSHDNQLVSTEWVKKNILRMEE